MSWAKLLKEKRVASEPTSKKELDDIRAMADTNLKDALVAQLSAQGRYEFAYNTARLMASLLVRASGYRVTGGGHHYSTFQALEAVDPAFAGVAAYFDQAREKRNDFSYDSPVAISDTDANDLTATVQSFVTDAETWVSSKDPTLSK